MEIPDNWTFKNQSIADNFDNHVREQLPWYDLATFIVEHYVRAFTPEKGLVYDLGCSTGNTELACRGLIHDRKLQWIGVDNSENMLKLYRGSCNPKLADIVECEYQPFDVAICFLCLMFVSIERRSSLLKKLLYKMKQTGRIILIDKFIPPSGYDGMVQNKLTMAMKLKQGVESNEILNKEVSLLGTQMPMLESELREFDKNRIFKIGDFEGFLLSRKQL